MNKKYRMLFEEIVNSSKAKIIDLADTELKNDVKKQKLDNYIIKIINQAMDRLRFTPIAKWAVRQFVIPYVDVITQYIYDLLKARVIGVTK